MEGGRITYGCPYERSVSYRVNDGQSTRLLLLGLTAGRRDPSEDDTVNAVRADGKHDHGEVLRAEVQCRKTQNETEDCNGFGKSDVPCALIEAARRIAVGDRTDSGDEVRWASKGESDLSVEVEGLDDGGEEVLEAVCSKVHVLHESKEPELGVRCGCLETGEWRNDTLFANSVKKDTLVCQDTLFGREPFGVERIVWKNEARNNGYDEGCDTLDDEQPLPAGEIDCSIKLEDSDGDEAGECRCKNVSRVQD
jgi:hypothetical protein